MKRGWLLVAVALAVLAMPSASAATQEVRIKAGPKFEPSDVSINEGDTIKWIAEVNGHTVTSDGDGQAPWTADGRFDESVSTTDPFEFTFDDPGTFHYFCRPHSSFMQGRVLVAAVVTDSFPPTTSPTMVTVTDSFPTTDATTAATGTGTQDGATGPGNGTPFPPVVFVLAAAWVAAWRRHG